MAEPVRLTPQEEAVMKLLVDGASYKRISEELSISTSTVETHVQNIKRKANRNGSVHGIVGWYLTEYLATS